MRVTVEKHRRLLTLWDGDLPVFTAAIALGRAPERIEARAGRRSHSRGPLSHLPCKKEQGRYGLSLDASYPNAADAQTAFAQGRIDNAALNAVLNAQASGARPVGQPAGRGDLPARRPYRSGRRAASRWRLRTWPFYGRTATKLKR